MVGLDPYNAAAAAVDSVDYDIVVSGDILEDVQIGVEVGQSLAEVPAIDSPSFLFSPHPFVVAHH